MEERKDTQRISTSSDIRNTQGSAIVLPVIEEQVTIDKKEIDTGTVRITRHVFEHTEPVHVVVSHDECKVDRVPAGYYVDKAPEVRWEGDTMIIPVLKEVAVVEKKLLLVEELHVKKTVIHESHTENVTLRKEGIEVSRIPTDGSSPETL
jgi:uncharacterized protein (TIGR02271 family)